MLSSILTTVTRHRVAANVLMLIFFLAGIYAIVQLKTQFLPDFAVNIITVSVTMRNATSADIEDAVITPLENSLRSVPDYKELRSLSRENSALIIMEFPENTDLTKALSDVKAEVERVDLPEDADPAFVQLIEPTEPSAEMTLVGLEGPELRQLARQISNELNAANFGKIVIAGLPEEEIEVLVNQRRLLELNLSLAQVGQAIGAQNHESSVGKLSGLGNVRNIRADTKSAELDKLLNLPITAAEDGTVVFLRDIATASRRPISDQITLRYNGKPAVTYTITPNSSSSVIATANRLYEWADSKRATLPANVELVMHHESWRFIESRINLLVDNAISGIIIVLAILFFFLSTRVAFWVAASIPVAVLGTLFIFLHTGGTINMLSSFALIMAIGLIVDDSIVLAENALTRYKAGAPPMRAVTSAAKTMFVPIVSSAFTTIAAFLPLFLITGPIGAIVFDIPLIIVCILCMAVLECFLVLPGHLYHSFSKSNPHSISPIRQGIDSGFEIFAQKIFRPAVAFAVRHASATVAATFMLMVLSVSLLTNNIVQFRFFPSSGGSNLDASITFYSGTPRETVSEFVDQLLVLMREVDDELDSSQQLVEHVSVFSGQGGMFDTPGDHLAHIQIELIDVEHRSVTLEHFTETWRKRAPDVPGIDKLDIRSEATGPIDRDIELRLIGVDPLIIKAAAEKLKSALRSIPDLESISDDTSFGKEELVFSLTPLGRSLNLNVSDVANQLRFAFDGYNVQSFTEGVDEFDLRVKLDGINDNTIESLYLRLPNGEYAPLGEIVTWYTENSFDTITHQSGRTAISVFADLSISSTSDVATILRRLEETTLIELNRDFGVSYQISGGGADQAQTAKEMQTGLVLAIVLIYITLTLVFSSWSLPLIVMLTMPTGVVGAIVGHAILGLEMSILSFFGLFTLMGILVNNSIILISCLQNLGVENSDAKAYNEAIVQAAVIRLRAVTLTTCTTIGGLLPILLETSLQAKFLQPMAASICFGLAFASLIILMFMPACLAIHGKTLRGINRLRSIRIRLPILRSKDI